MHVFCDFDGTISRTDTTDEILSRFAAPEWELIEQEWKRGEIGSAECMRRQIALLNVSREQLDETLDTLPIDPEFIGFVRFCGSHHLPITIISDGVDYFIHRILQRYHLDFLPVIANKLTQTGAQSFALSSPYSNPECGAAAGVCKCNQLGNYASTRVFVGDGRSDFCAVESADIVFAKSALAVYCEQQSIAYHAYQGFSDVTAMMRRLLAEHAAPQSATRTAAFA